MVASASYDVVEILDEGLTHVVYRAVRRADGAPVIIKALRGDPPAPRDARRLRNEYDVCRRLGGPYVLRVLGLDGRGEHLALVTEDSGGEPLSKVLGAPMEVGRFLDLAFLLAAAVGDIHRQGVVHRDLKPANVLVHPHTGAVKITDFGSAAPLARAPAAEARPTVIEGSLPYISPEQTGRLGRGVDHRSDLYSLGVTLYEMLTGALPFQASDPLGWVHCHVAREPAPPQQLVPSIPAPVARIVLKLLSKQPDDRYQSARGLHADLERCRQQRQCRGRIEPFPLGEHDVCDQLLISHRLYGREEQLDALLAAFGRVATTGRPEVVLVAGYSGVGKSSLVGELRPSVVRGQGLFMSGKFDQQRRDVPYATFAQAFDGLARQILAESEERVRAWREAIAQALGANGRLLTDLVPRLACLLGPQPPVADLPPTEAERRFHWAFSRFLGAVATGGRPLVLFLDDLQWLDAGSLRLLAHLLTDPETRHLLLIGAYRDNEVSASPP
jgi:serine/threonine protein kinase